ncbi:MULTISPECIES: hypothetical protein [unclassified Sphingomonas]|uniref:hypothetical protein n=1 Tax=unclassified Sphingomonas TaxID=196159 RepID=UPI000E75C9C4|nr:MULTISPECIES: hypothetical protein [unclassified Sphingomonas]RKE45875.1 hypothetical protein C8J39_3014 [Sphingomonas sp. PP-CC-1A-547]TCM06823.1 hypothetical protein C8J41_104247 [Sphingomonas sp. PP-CC-3G-468]
MADYNEQVIRHWEEWSAQTGQDSGDPNDFIDWAMANGKLNLRPQDVRQVFRRQVTQALRQEKRYDEAGGFTYRAKQCVTLFDNGVSTKHYFDIDTGGTPTKRQKSARQRREAIAHDVYRAVCDVERMNKNFPDDPQLNFYLAFDDDVAEHRAAEQAERDKGEEAA